MPGSFVESARAADAHDAGCGAVSWTAQGQLMRMMLGLGHFVLRLWRSDADMFIGLLGYLIFPTGPKF